MPAFGTAKTRESLPHAAITGMPLHHEPRPDVDETITNHCKRPQLSRPSDFQLSTPIRLRQFADPRSQPEGWSAWFLFGGYSCSPFLSVTLLTGTYQAFIRLSHARAARNCFHENLWMH